MENNKQSRPGKTSGYRKDAIVDRQSLHLVLLNPVLPMVFGTGDTELSAGPGIAPYRLCSAG